MSRTPNLAELVKTEPAVFLAAVQAAITLAAQFGLTLTAAETGGLLAATSALLALVTAAMTHPFKLAALTGFVTATGTVLLAFGIPHVAPGAVSALNMVIVAAFAFLGVRPQVTPKASLRKPVPAVPVPQSRP